MSVVDSNWTLVKDPDFEGYTNELLAKMSVQLRRAERDDPTTVVVAGSTCALRCCLRRWSRLLDEPPPSADEGVGRLDGGEDGGDGDGDGTTPGSGRERGVELD